MFDLFNRKKLEEITDRLSVMEKEQERLIGLVVEFSDRLKVIQSYVIDAKIKLESSTDIVANGIMKDKDDRLNTAGLYNYRDYRAKHPAVSVGREREVVIDGENI